MKYFDIEFEPLGTDKDVLVGDFPADEIGLEEIAREMNATKAAPGWLAVCGHLGDDETHRLYLLPSVDPVDIARRFGVGATAGEHDEALSQLRAIHGQNPIIPFFADGAGFKFTFANPVTPSLADFLAQTLTVGLDEQMLNEDGDLNVLETGVVHLWWD